VRGIWGLGDYHRFATETVWEVGPVLVEACGITGGLRVLDVAAGSGNVAIRAAQAGADVVACDITPEQLEAGRQAAAAHRVTIEWVEADAAGLPFADGEFDAVTSAFGAIFAPDHRCVAGELVRVCRPGGTIAMANFTPDGLAAEFFGLFAPHLPPPPPGALPPVLWGDEAHIRELFGDRVDWLQLTRATYTERADNPTAYCELFKSSFGPVIAAYATLEDNPARSLELDRAFLDFATRNNHGPRHGPAEYPYEYLLAVAHKATRPAAFPIEGSSKSAGAETGRAAGPRRLGGIDPSRSPAGATVSL